MEKTEKVILKHLRKAVKKEKLNQLTDTSLFKEDLSLDSLKMVSLFSSIINDLNISITEFNDTELFNIQSVGDLKNIFQEKLEIRG